MFRLDVDGEVCLVLAEERHAPALAALGLRNRDRLARWEPWAEEPGAFSTESTAKFLRGALTGFSHGRQVQTIIALEGGNRFVGSCGLRVDPAAGVADIGYWIDGQLEGRGIATRAAGAMVTLAFGELEMRQVELRTAPDNHRSQAVAARLGFQLRGRQLGALRFERRVEDLLVFARTATQRQPSHVSAPYL